MTDQKKILIIGGAGFIGNELSRLLLAKPGFNVKVADINTNEFLKDHSFYLDILDRKSFDKILADYDIIINLTGQITNPISKCFSLNTEGIKNIISFAKKCEAVLYQISTVSVYGTADKVDENTIPAPESPYAAFKAFVDFQIKNEMEKEKFCILRIPNLIGWEQKKGLFAYLRNSYFTDKKLSFNNNGTLTRYFLEIGECAEAISIAVENNFTGLYILPSVEKRSILEIINLFEKIKKTKFEVEFDTKEPIENISSIDSDLFTFKSNFKPHKTITDIISEVTGKNE